MHDGRNAWGFVQLAVTRAGVVPQETMLLTRVSRPLRHHAHPPGTVIPLIDLDFDDDPALLGVTVFETTARIAVDPLNNEIRLHKPDTTGPTDVRLKTERTETTDVEVPVVSGFSRTIVDWLVEETGIPVAAA